MSLDVSVVIPTYNRRDTLAAVLPVWTRQTLPPDRFEILLCDSLSTDGTDALVRESGLPQLRHLVGDHRTRAGARNAGLAAARAPLVLFTDADIIPDERLLEEHLAAHAAAPGSAVVGCEVRVDSLREYEAMRSDPAARQRRTLHRPTRRRLPWLYFLTGNASAARDTLRQVGGFDEAFTGYGHEDLELGYRIEQAGVPIRYRPSALNYHWHPVSFEEQCRRMRLAGHSTVRFVRKHRNPKIQWLLGMTPLSLGLYGLVRPGGWALRTLEGWAAGSRLCSEIVLQCHYVSGIKDALKGVEA